MKLYQHPTYTEKAWLAVEIGNSRQHWGLFIGETLVGTGEESIQNTLREGKPTKFKIQNEEGLGTGDWGLGTGDWGKEIISLLTQHRLTALSTPLPVVIASVVPKQTAIWETYPHVRVLTLDQVPLKQTYPTLGIDRVLALWGAGMTWGFPMLVIDAGTALTFTCADANQCLVGGAILPGLGLQLASLGQKTEQLPHLNIDTLQSLPPRFALNTPQAIESGVIYTLLSGIKDFLDDWWRLFPDGKVAMKGGDRTLLFNYLQVLYPEIAQRLILEPNLIFWGMQKILMQY
ncbi:pantothenate kinase [Nostoc sp. CENA543]|uniref:pantothenate kinase n=1 Tax=Nostoc sp. CENA543 TaxID=1869241 RepID=UPI000CA1ACBC|nr:pantothenate kinase [Nostoc sp. CENA543]AUT03633.1 pantothenate kinase [Nostoc sp. CENA543]